MKVQITKGVHSYSYDGKQYLPGDTLDIDSACFRADFMEAVPEEAPAVEVAESEPELVVEEVKVEEAEEKSESAPVSKKRRS